MRRRVSYRQGRESQSLLQRQLHHLLVDQPHALFPEQYLEVVQRVVIRTSFRFGQTTQVPCWRVVPNQVFCLAEREVSGGFEQQRANQRTKMRRASGGVLQLRRPNFLGQIQQFVPIQLVCEDHQLVRRLDRNGRSLGAEYQLSLASPAFLRHACPPSWSRSPKCTSLSIPSRKRSFCLRDFGPPRLISAAHRLNYRTSCKLD